MAKKAAESDENGLKKKVAAKLANHSNPEGDAAMRSLRKRLKREQRKRRAIRASITPRMFRTARA